MRDCAEELCVFHQPDKSSREQISCAEERFAEQMAALPGGQIRDNRRTERIDPMGALFRFGTHIWSQGRFRAISNPTSQSPCPAKCVALRESTKTYVLTADMFHKAVKEAKLAAMP